MKKTLLTLTLLATLAACGGGEDPRLEKVHANAPSWSKAYSDTQLVDMMDDVCKDPADILEQEARIVGGSDKEWGYVVGVAKAGCE
jgi:hypothetical protein